jgi:hypothetical protein
MAYVVAHIEDESFVAHLEPNPGVEYDCLSLVTRHTDGRLRIRFMLNRNGINANVLDQVWKRFDEDGCDMVAHELMAASGLVAAEPTHQSSTSQLCEDVVLWIERHRSEEFCVGPIGWPGSCRTLLEQVREQFDNAVWPISDHGPEIVCGISQVEVKRFSHFLVQDPRSAETHEHGNERVESPKNLSRGTSPMEIKYTQFDALAAEKIQWYVYALRDPRNNEVFYIGKGKRNRWFDHILEARKKFDDPKLKLQRIRDIEGAGYPVDPFIIRSGIKSESHAYDVEGAVIHSFRLLERSGSAVPFDLTNIAEVHYPERGLASIPVMQSLLNAPLAPAIEVPVGIFKIGVLWYPEMTTEDVRLATLGWWPNSKTKNGRKKAKYAFGVSDGIIRGVYRIDLSMWRERRELDRDWEHDIGREPRWGFPECVPAPEMSRYLNTSVKELFKRGDQNSIKFVNCS